MKPAYTAKTCIAELDGLATNFKKSLRGFRTRLYGTLTYSQRIIVRLNKNEQLRRKFILAIKKRSESTSAISKKRTERLNLSTEVVALATGAASRSARKLAWKRGRVLDLLREDGVKIEKTAKEIRARGGIEKIVRDAAREVKKRPVTESPPRSTVLPAKSSNDGKTALSIRMRLSQRDEILEKSSGSLLSLRVRVGKDAALELAEIEQRDTVDESKDDWE